MQRCVLSRRTLARTLLAATALFAGLTALPAQAARNFPATALRGELVVTAPPEATMNGKAIRLAPGARIRNTGNMIMLSGTVVGQKLVVNYTLDSMGQPLDIWVLQPEEQANSPWPRTLEQAQTWSFDAAAQTWTKP